MPGLSLVPAFTCAVCAQLIDLERQQLDTSEAVLFGAERFAWCVECGQQVPQPWSEEYKRLWIRAVRTTGRVPTGVVWRLRAAWQQGARARQSGEALVSCPLPAGRERQAWVDGYLAGSESEPARALDSAFRRWLCTQKLRRTTPAGQPLR